MSKDRPLYWSGRDWRYLFLRRTGAACNLAQAIEVRDQGNSKACAGFAVAHALRANVAIHRHVDIGQVNPYLIAELARRSDADLRYNRAGFLHEALLVVNTYGIPSGNKPDENDLQGVPILEIVEKNTLDWKKDPVDPDPHVKGIPALMSLGSHGKVPATVNGSFRKIQGIVDLTRYAGDHAAWLTAFGPTVVHMIVDREEWKAIGKRPHPVPLDELASRGFREKHPPIIKYNPGRAHDGELSTRYAGHDVVVVGYVPDLGDGDERADSFIVMNSYGPEWGQYGFAYIPVETARMSFRAVYGLLLREHLAYKWRGDGPAPRTPCYMNVRTKDIKW